MSYIKQIESLVILQDIDKEMGDLEKTLEAAPKEVETLKERLEIQENQRKQVEEKLKILQEQDEKLTKELEEDQAKLKKSKNKLMMVENSKEYHAIMREIDTLEKNSRLKEEEKLTLEEELDTQQRLLDALNEEISKISEELQQKEDALDKIINRCESRIKELKEKRAEFAKQIPPPILSRYEFIRARLSNPVIVPVEDSICTGCHISIPPQTYIELQKGLQILSCPNCQRLIYWKNHFEVE
ncbi:zinc ribbon domain-containing protein [Desulfothermus sp.]